MGEARACAVRGCRVSSTYIAVPEIGWRKSMFGMTFESGSSGVAGKSAEKTKWKKVVVGDIIP